MIVSPSDEEPRRPSDAARRSGPALEAMFRFIVWLIPTLDKLPRAWWVVTSAALRAPPYVLVSRYATRAALPLLAGFQLLGLVVAAALAPSGGVAPGSLLEWLPVALWGAALVLLLHLRLA